MKVLYDHQAFMWSKYSGIPRYFCELIERFQNDIDVTPVFPKGWCQNYDYRNLIGMSNPPLSWRVCDSILNLSKNTINKDISAYLSNLEKKSISMLKQGKYDIFHPTHFSQYYLKYVQDTNLPVVITVHDFTYEKYSEYYSIKSAARVIQNTRLALENATHIICISEYTKNELLTYYDIDNSKIDVIHHGLPSLSELAKVDIIDDNVLRDDDNYLLFVGVRNGHKNFYMLMVSLRLILHENNLKLICVGAPFSDDEMLYINSLGLASRVISVSANNIQLVSLYRNALAFIFPSVNEGFGFPILEAFSCGCPVLCSDGSSFPEIAGDAAVYFNPKMADSIQGAVLKILHDPKLRQKMSQKGYQQLETFSWKKCAEDTKAVYRKVIS